MNIQEQENFRRRAKISGSNRDALTCDFGKEVLKKIMELNGEDFYEIAFRALGVIPWFVQMVAPQLGYVRVKMGGGRGREVWGYTIPQDKREKREIKEMKKKIPILEAENETLRKQIEGVKR